MFRRSPRALALRALAVVVAVVTAIVVASDLAALHRRAGDLGTERSVLVATRDLPVGRAVERADVRARRVHASQLPPGVLRGLTPSRVLGRVVAVAVLRGSYLGVRNLAPRERSGLDGVVPRGMRAMRVVVSDALRPRPGAAVDVLASFDARTLDSDERTASTVLVAAGVRVLRTDTRAGSGTGRGDPLGVTLLVDAGQAELLADAQAHGVLTLALVPPEEASR
jgi:Flp pilus assembly protein CpaB